MRLSGWETDRGMTYCCYVFLHEHNKNIQPTDLVLGAVIRNKVLFKEDTSTCILTILRYLSDGFPSLSKISASAGNLYMKSGL